MINIDKQYISDNQHSWLNTIPDVEVGDQVRLEKIHGMRSGSHKSKLFQVIDIRKYANNTNIMFEFQSVKKDGTLGKIYEERYCKNNKEI